MKNLHGDAKDFLMCCGSSKFAAEMAKSAPFSSLSQAVEASRTIWWNEVDVPGWLEAFTAHPRIGDLEALKKGAPSAHWSKVEQSVAVETANVTVMRELSEWNQKYEEKFGFRYLICASGKSSAEILANLQNRFSSRPIEELQVAAGEQQKITEIRLGKLFADRDSFSQTTANQRLGQVLGHIGSSVEESKVSLPSHLSVPNQISPTRPPITTHVLDVSRGKPGAGIPVTLELWNVPSKGGESRGWISIGSSVTDADGRSGPLMAPSSNVMAGRYKLTFGTATYFQNSNSSDDTNGTTQCFYPYVSVVFEIKPAQVSQHFHVPVLLSPFSYTTYRGS
ncbi:hypothetical protein GOP47_0024765 [Adiantum capillus-veneris]|uniref:Hydroxyisourate hydrolase n=1 Tax=Adiantum capillus-veneris TaxID=13818 RepID=A0A9D4U3G9_ADICA|nr:hypothetical protein GOP47_0024765 [Adiantum capillus-veneris]